MKRLKRGDLEIQKLEEEIFLLDNFNYLDGFFPKKIFKKNYFCCFLAENYFFQYEKDFSLFIDFLKKINEVDYIVNGNCYGIETVDPSPYLLEFSIDDSFEVYFSAIRALFDDLKDYETQYSFGLHVYSENCFFYSREKTWAMVHIRDFSMIVIGVEKHLENLFREHYNNFLIDPCDYYGNLFNSDFFRKMKENYNF